MQFLNDNKLVRLSLNSRRAVLQFLAEEEIHRRLAGGVKTERQQRSVWEVRGSKTVN